MSVDDENIIDELLRKYTKTAVSIYAKNIADGLKEKLDTVSESIVRDSERILLATLTRRIVQILFQHIREIIDDVLVERIAVIEDQIRRLIRQELERVKTYAHPRQPVESRETLGPSATELEKLKKQIIDLSSQLRMCKMNLAKASERLGKFFNLILRFEPRFHALPIIEQSGEIDIDELARILRMRKQDLLKFLRITTEAGITYIRGNKVSLVVPIFKSL
mgnify:CR=1 FL=1